MSSISAIKESPADADTPSRILDVAEELVQTRGFNDVSYADVAARLGITKPSVHYHFPSKAMLGEAMIRRYSTRFFAELALIDEQEAEPGRKLERYAGLYRVAVAAGRMCLCGILAAEYHTLPDSMRAAVIEFFDRNESWLVGVLVLSDTGKGAAHDDAELRRAARAIIDSLEGSVMLARAYDDASRFEAVAARIVERV